MNESGIEAVALTPYDSLFFGDGRGVPITGDVDTLPYPPPLTLSGAILTMLVREKGPADVLRKMKFGEDEEERGEVLRLAFYGPILEYRGEHWVPAPRDLVIVWARRDSAKLMPMTPVSGEGSGYRGQLPPRIMGTDRVPLYDQDQFPTIVKLEALLSRYPRLPLIVRNPPRLTLEDRLGIALDRSRGVVERGMIYRTSHLRVQEEDGVRASFLMLSPPLDGRDTLPDFDSRVIRLGGEGRGAEARRLRAGWASRLFQDRELKPGAMVRVILLSPAIYLRNGVPVSRPDLDELEESVRFLEDRTFSGKPVMVSGWNSVLGRARTMYPAVPAGTVYTLQITGRMSSLELMLAFWRSSLYWDRGMGSPIVLEVSKNE